MLVVEGDGDSVGERKEMGELLGVRATVKVGELVGERIVVIVGVGICTRAMAVNVASLAWVALIDSRTPILASSRPNPPVMIPAMIVPITPIRVAITAGSFIQAFNLCFGSASCCFDMAVYIFNARIWLIVPPTTRLRYYRDIMLSGE